MIKLIRLKVASNEIIIYNNMIFTNLVLKMPIKTLAFCVIQVLFSIVYLKIIIPCLEK